MAIMKRETFLQQISDHEKGDFPAADQKTTELV
jgi:hypothetical protein